MGFTLAAGWLACSAALAEQMSVQVRQGPMRSAPSYTGQVVTSLAYGDRVEVLEKRPGWIRVSSGGKSGWLHVSALSPKRIVLQSGTTTAQSGATSEEIALAGKGFNSQVESRYKAQNSQANYAAVDRMEKQSVSPREKAAFLSEGGLRQE
jgi:SH3-like domain-containing protein